MKKNWRSTLGGACAALGAFLFGIPLLVSASSIDFPKPFMVWCMKIGIVMNGVGIFVAHFFGADAKELSAVKDQVAQNKVAIDTTVQKVQDDDTDHLKRDIATAQSSQQLANPKD